MASRKRTSPAKIIKVLSNRTVEKPRRRQLAASLARLVAHTGTPKHLCEKINRLGLKDEKGYQFKEPEIVGDRLLVMVHHNGWWIRRLEGPFQLYRQLAQ